MNRERRVESMLDRHRRIIDKFGWSVTGVLATAADPPGTTPYYYTAGLTQHGFPELAITGIDPRNAHDILNMLADRVYSRAVTFQHGQVVDDVLGGGYRAVIVDGTPDRDTIWPGAANAIYGEDRVRLQQVVWPDRSGHYPWDDGYELPPTAQPIIGAIT